MVGWAGLLKIVYVLSCRILGHTGPNRIFNRYRHDRQTAYRRHQQRSWPVLQWELVLGTGAELNGLVVDDDLDGRCATRARADLHVVLG
jgi:hypothetical protein